MPREYCLHAVLGFVPTAHNRLDYRETKEQPMTLNITLVPLVSLIAGILILIKPKLLNFIVAVYLIFVGLVGLFGLRF